jgi:ribonuclease D
MLKQSTPKIMSEVQALSNEAWNEFTATSPEGIDYIAEASVRGLMVARIRRAVTRGEADRRALRERALSGLS